MRPRNAFLIRRLVHAGLALVVDALISCGAGCVTSLKLFICMSSRVVFLPSLMLLCLSSSPSIPLDTCQFY